MSFSRAFASLVGSIRVSPRSHPSESIPTNEETAHTVEIAIT
jgi:hypothetical protein